MNSLVFDFVWVLNIITLAHPLEKEWSFISITQDQSSSNENSIICHRMLLLSISFGWEWGEVAYEEHEHSYCYERDNPLD